MWFNYSAIISKGSIVRQHIALYMNHDGVHIVRVDIYMRWCLFRDHSESISRNWLLKLESHAHPASRSEMEVRPVEVGSEHILEPGLCHILVARRA